MKKITLTLLCLVCAVCCAFGLTACSLFGNPDTGSDKAGYLTFKLYGENSYAVLKCDTNAEGQIDIPATFKNKPVTYINVGAFERCENVTGVSIPNSVTGIDFGAFSGCTNITSITIPNSVTKIGEKAFEDCENLATVNIPDSVISIGSGAFYGTAWYNNKEDGLIYVGKVAYKYKGHMSFGAEIPFKTDTIGIADRAFEDIDSILEVTVPDGVKRIGTEAFSHCINLHNITIPDSVTSIGRDAFKSTRWLNNQLNDNGYLLPGEEVVYLGKFLLVYNSKTAINVNVKSGTKYIADDAFAGCKVGDVTIPDGLTSIGDGAFSNCELGYISIPASVTSIGEQAFLGCASININFDGTKEQWNAVKKGQGWDRITGEYYTVHYSDGSMEQIDKK